MSQLFTPKNAERKIFQLAIFQDGIWDMQIGGMIMLFSFYPVTRRLLGPVWNAFLILGLLIAWLFVGATLKRTLSNPRMGLVKFGQKQKSKLRIMQLSIFGIFLLSTALAVSLIMKIFQGPNWGASVPGWQDFRYGPCLCAGDRCDFQSDFGCLQSVATLPLWSADGRRVVRHSCVDGLSRH